jgi:hypothetical protein
MQLGLVAIVALHSRHRYDYLKEAYSLAEAFLWLGIYLTINLQLSSLRAAFARRTASSSRRTRSPPS